jgi:hypothetical protein
MEISDVAEFEQLLCDLNAGMSKQELTLGSSEVVRIAMTDRYT